jgi:hypothetical protein
MLVGIILPCNDYAIGRGTSSLFHKIQYDDFTKDLGSITLCFFAMWLCGMVCRGVMSDDDDV